MHRMLVFEHERRPAGEVALVALFLHRKALDRDTVDEVGAGWVVIAPRHVVARAGRVHRHVCVCSQMLGDVSRVQLGSTAHVGSVPLHDDRELHGSSAGPPAAASGAGAATAAPSAGVSAGASGSIVVRSSVVRHLGRRRLRRSILRAVRAARPSPAAPTSPPPPPALAGLLGSTASRLTPTAGAAGVECRHTGAAGRLLWLLTGRLRALFQFPDAPLVVVYARGKRFHPERQALHLDARARDLGDQPLDERVVQRVPLGLRPFALQLAAGRFLVQAGLGVQRVRDRIGVEEQLEDGLQQVPQRAQQPVVRVEDRVVLELVGGCRFHRRDRCRRTGVLAQLIEEGGLQGARVEDGLETPGRQLLNLAGRQVDAVALRDARLDLPDDLIDVDRVGFVATRPGPVLVLGGLALGLLRLGPSIASAIGAAPAAMEVGTASPVRVLISWHTDSACGSLVLPKRGIFGVYPAGDGF